MVTVHDSIHQTVTKDANTDSSFSNGEKEIISYLRDRPEMSHQEIADEKTIARGTVNNAVARVRDKTRTAFATLLASPHTEEVARELDDENVDELITHLRRTKEHE